MTPLPPHDRRVAAALLAHPDDCEILCAGTMLRLGREHGYELHIVTATFGDCGSATEPPEVIAARRAGEARAAAALANATHHCLGLRDLHVFLDSTSVSAAVDLFRRINPTLVFTHPRHDYMLDHEQVHLIARAATFGFAIPNASTRVVPAAARVPHLYYCDPLGGADPYTGDPVRPDVLVDVSAVHEAKLAMLAAHQSQRDWLRSHHGMDEYLEAARRHDAARGAALGVRYAEAFTRHRGHAYPADDLLGSLLSR
jgi:LmbE family N-acetylglucosaminyl deacetylase